MAFDVIPSAFEETPPAGATPRAEDHARDMAAGKALEVATRADEVRGRDIRGGAESGQRRGLSRGGAQSLPVNL